MTSGYNHTEYTIIIMQLLHPRHQGQLTLTILSSSSMDSSIRRNMAANSSVEKWVT